MRSPCNLYVGKEQLFYVWQFLCQHIYGGKLEKKSWKDMMWKQYACVAGEVYLNFALNIEIRGFLKFLLICNFCIPPHWIEIYKKFTLIMFYKQRL